MSAPPDDLVTHAAHDRHFLERLARVDSRRADLALRLYRDPNLVRRILADASTPASAERVALPLAPGPEAPKVLVERSGAFVTCLGAEMEVTEAPLFPWRRMEVLLSSADVRVALEDRAQKALADTDAGKLVERMYHRGARVSREDFLAAQLLEPLLGEVYVDECLESMSLVIQASRTVARLRHDTGEDGEMLRLYWKNYWWFGHTLLLSGSGGKRSFDVWRRRLPDREPVAAVHLPVLPLVILPVAARALWAIGRAGKPALVPLKRALGEATAWSLWAGAALGLAALGRRHRRLQAEAEGAVSLGRLPAPLRDHPDADYFVRALRTAFCEPDLSEALEAEPVQFRRMHAALALFTLELHGRVEEEEVAARMAEPLLMPRLANHLASPLGAHGNPLGYAYTASALATLPAEEFYYPAACVEEAPAGTLEEVKQTVEWRRPVPTHRREAPKVGRNEPCPCQSGKKYKRCCGT